MLIYCCADLIFATKIGSTAQVLDLPARPARNPQMLADRLADSPVTRVFVDMDLGEVGVAMIRQVKAHDTTIQVVAFGAHVAVDLLAAAREAGADEVMARGRFTAILPDLLRA